MSGPPDSDVAVAVPSGARVLSLEPSPASSLRVRNFVSEFAVEHGLTDIVEDAALCATELATNAILHTRDQFVVTVRPVGIGVRLDVLDMSPDQLPMMTPRAGSAVDLTTFGNSGRGLQIVAALSARWGVFATDEAKTVWAEVTGQPNPLSTEPLMVLRQTALDHEDLVRLRYLDLPVRAAVASGIQVEDVMRDIALEPRKTAPHQQEVQRLTELLDRSASIRLVGRHAALTAAAAGQSQFDLEIYTTNDALEALGELSTRLRDVDAVLSIAIPPLQDEVIEFRKWLNEESSRQMAGLEPSHCPLA